MQSVCSVCIQRGPRVQERDGLTTERWGDKRDRRHNTFEEMLLTFPGKGTGCFLDFARKSPFFGRAYLVKVRRPRGRSQSRGRTTLLGFGPWRLCQGSQHPALGSRGESREPGPRLKIVKDEDRLCYRKRKALLFRDNFLYFPSFVQWIMSSGGGRE